MRDAGLGPALLESDRRYFEMAASCEDMPGATLVWTPGLAHLAAGCVVHRVDPGVLSSGERWLAHVEDRLRRLGASWLRVYVEGRPEQLRAVLEGHGCRPRAENGYAGLSAGPPAREVALVPVGDEAGWDEKLWLHQREGPSTSLYQASARDWVELERRKCQSGTMRAFLVTVGGAVCGTVSAILTGPVLRAKNLLIARRSRGLGLGRAALGELSRLAERGGAEGVGAFAVEGSAGERLYRRAGFRAVTSQVEWSRPLSEGLEGWR